MALALSKKWIANFPTKIGIRTGDRLDSIAFTYNNVVAKLVVPVELIKNLF